MKLSIQKTSWLLYFLALHGLRYKNKGRQSWGDYFKKLRSWDGNPLFLHLKEELFRETDRLTLVEKQLVEIEEKMLKALQNKRDPVIQQVIQLITLKAIVLISAWELVMEWFSWRNLKTVAN